MYTYDIYENKVRIIYTNGLIDLLAGNGIAGFSGDGGLAISASLKGPHKIALDTCNNPYLSDLNNYRFRKLSYSHCNYLEVEDSPQNNTTTIHPNTTTSTLQIDNIKAITQYHLYSMLGSSLMQGTLKPGNNTLQMDALEQGIYMLALIDEEG